jgi:bacteriophage exclusion system BrxB-like protein
MDETLHHRLNQIPDKILSQEFLDAKGLGNEIGFWIFDYDPQAELEVREYISFLQDMLATKHSHLNVVHINLLSSLVEYLEERGFIDKAIELQKRKGDEGLLKALSGPLHMDKFAPYLVETRAAEERDMILISGVGSVWPLLRAHNLLNSLHSLLGHKPVVLFYPGEYTGQSMSLFGKIPSSNYYRAFKLVP